MTEGINRILDNPSVNALRVATSLYTREAYYPTKEHTMERVKGFFQHISLYIIALAKWLCIGGGVGLIGGVVGAAFHIGVEQATELRLAQPWIIWLLPVGGVVIVGLYRLAHMEGRGTNNIIESVHFGKDVPILLVPLIFISTCITHLLGGSAGREGAALQIGGDLGEHFGKMLRMDDKDCRLATLCGMSALFSALFGTPLAAVFFALEVVSIGVLYYSGLIPCITSSLVAYAVSLRFGIEPMRFAVAAPETDALTLARAAALALGCALVSILFCEALHRTEHLAARLVKNDYLRAFLGGCLVIALTLLAGCRDYNGAGGHVIAAALGGTAKPEAFLLKIVFTAVTLGCGFKGGEIVPTLFVGSTFGCAAGALLGLPAGFAAALGITGLFCGMTNCPLTSLLISVELFGADGLLCYAVVCAVSYVCSGYRGLYSSQTILYSKLRAEFINVHTK